MAIEVKCSGCDRVLSVKDEFAGKRGSCPHCKQKIQVPSPSEPNDTPDSKEDFLAPTEKQLAYAEKIGVDIPDGVDRRELSKLIAVVSRDGPSPERKAKHMREMGVDIPEGASSIQINAIFDQVLDIEAKITPHIQNQILSRMEECGELLEHASDEQLLEQLLDRGREFLILLLDNDKYRHRENTPMRGKLWWSCGFEDDGKYVLMRVGTDWSQSRMEEYLEECEGKPYSIELDAREFDPEFEGYYDPEKE